MKPVIYTKIPSSDPALIARAAKFGVADLHEALGPVAGRMCLMSANMKPIARSGRAPDVDSDPADDPCAPARATRLVSDVDAAIAADIRTLRRDTESMRIPPPPSHAIRRPRRANRRESRRRSGEALCEVPIPSTAPSDPCHAPTTAA